MGIMKTRAHEGYSKRFNFTNVKEKDGENRWMKSRTPESKDEDNPKVIAIDCEMAGTKNPKTHETNSSALIRLAAVNGENPDDVLIDTLVKPEWPISQTREEIHGITVKHLNT